MIYQQDFLIGPGEVSVYHQSWLPEDEPRAVLLIIHGLAEHSGRYMNVVNHFVPLDYAVYGVDHIGHGKSEGERCYVDRFEDYIDTVRICRDMIRERHPGVPVVLLGHSMGGLIGACYLLEHQQDFVGAVLSGPSVEIPDSTPRTMVIAAKVLSRILPKAGAMKVNAEAVSRDPDVVRAYKEDPLVHNGKVTARLGAEVMKAIESVNERASEISLPLMLVHGEDDILVEPSASRMLYESVSSESKTLKIYPDLYHEIFNEPEHDVVLTDIERWLDTVIGTNPRWES